MKALIYLQRVVPLVGAALNRLRFPGLWTGLRVEITGPGRLSYGKGIRIGEGSRVDLLPDSSLSIGAGVAISRNVYLRPGHGIEQTIGAATSLQDSCRIYGSVIIGKGCILSPNVYISSGVHAFDTMPHRTINEQNHLAPAPSRPVRVFDDCWLGINVFISPGVTIGRGCVIGANSVVTQDLPPYSIAVGVPARVQRKRLDFKPRPRIEAAQEQDWPYFYDGFALDNAAGSGERVTEGDFIVALDWSGARIVRLCLSGDAGEIAHGDNRRSVPRKTDTIEFPLAAGTALPFLSFHASGACRIRWAELA